MRKLFILVKGVIKSEKKRRREMRKKVRKPGFIQTNSYSCDNIRLGLYFCIPSTGELELKIKTEGKRTF